MQSTEYRVQTMSTLLLALSSLIEVERYATPGDG